MQAASLIASIATLCGLVFAAWKYFQDRNKEIYERRLNEIYAPLYSLLSRQERFRSIFRPDLTVEEVPIFTGEAKRYRTKMRFGSGDFTIEQSVEDDVPLFDRKSFVDRCSNKGLARPRLLRLISEYELLIQLEDDYRRGSDEWQKVADVRVDVERHLVYEILDGYRECIGKLKLTGRNQIGEIGIGQK